MALKLSVHKSRITNISYFFHIYAFTFVFLKNAFENTTTKSTKEAPKSHEEWLDQEVERLRGPAIDTCIVVTSHSIYHVVLKQCAVRKVLNHLLAGQH